MDYLKSVLEVYELVLQSSKNYGGNAASKVKQEILHGLGKYLTATWITIFLISLSRIIYSSTYFDLLKIKRPSYL